jgi:hypothetical protein
LERKSTPNEVEQKQLTHATTPTKKKEKKVKQRIKKRQNKKAKKETKKRNKGIKISTRKKKKPK